MFDVVTEKDLLMQHRLRTVSQFLPFLHQFVMFSAWSYSSPQGAMLSGPLSVRGIALANSQESDILDYWLVVSPCLAV